MLEDVPDDLKGKDDMKGEASLKGHLANGAEDTSASQAYVPPNEKDDKQLARRHRPVARGQAPGAGGEGRCGPGEERSARAPATSPAPTDPGQTAPAKPN